MKSQFDNEIRAILLPIGCVYRSSLHELLRKTTIHGPLPPVSQPKKAARSGFRSPSTRNQTPINQSGHIDEDQMNTLIQKSSYRNLLADVNLDGKVDLRDIALISKMFGRHLP
jgi:hypothetical protein